jgi:hypothetical protein
LAAFAAHLPAFYHGLLATERPGALGPEDARPEMGIGFHVPEDQGGFACHRWPAALAETGAFDEAVR